MNNHPVSLRQYRPHFIGTLFIIIGSILIVLIPSGDPYQIANQAALIMGVAVIISSYIEFQSNIRNLIRLDVLMLVALYGLTLLEFLFQQPDFNIMVRTDDLKEVMALVATGFTGIAIGRHFPFHRLRSNNAHSVVLSRRAFMMALVLCTLIGYFHMLLAVGFNPVALIEEMMGPRFSQPWARGRFGGIYSLLNELGLMIYLIPAIAGVILARKPSFTQSQILLTRFLFYFTLFYGFSNGTRNIFAVYIITYICAYIVACPTLTTRTVIRLGITYTIVLMIAAQVILDFRKEGLANYISRAFEDSAPVIEQNRAERLLFIDYNLVTLTNIIGYFPQHAEYLGLEVPYWALIKPVPRVLWPEKPKGLSIQIEEVRHVRGAAAATWAATFLGEAYMGGGLFGVTLASFLFGFGAAWWNKRFIPGTNIYQNLLYASGIFAALISIRSMFWLTTGILPALALVFYSAWFSKKIRQGTVQLAHPI